MMFRHIIRHLIANFLGAAVILVVAAAVLWSFPVRAAECRGETLTASWYGAESGNRTASGEYFDGRSLTAAHRSLPFNTRLRVTYRGKSVVVRINDRGPYHRGRGLDLSRAAAARVGLIEAGHGRVCVERVR